jgi:hypothetical protein
MVGAFMFSAWIVESLKRPYPVAITCT